MFIDESHIVSCLINSYDHKVFFKRKYSVFNFMFTENGFYWSTCYFIFKGTNFLIYSWHNMNFPFWEMVLVDAFVIWYYLNEFLSTNLYFFTSFLKKNLSWFSIVWAFGYELTKPLIVINILIPCYDMIIMTIYKGIIFITATFNWIRAFKELSIFKWSKSYL